MNKWVVNGYLDMTGSNVVYENKDQLKGKMNVYVAMKLAEEDDQQDLVQDKECKIDLNINNTKLLGQLIIQLMHAKELINLDTNGVSDPYV